MKMSPTSLREQGRTLCVIEKGQGATRICPKGAVVAAVGKHITFVPDILDTFDVKGWQPVHYDLLVLSAAVEFADRRWRRPHGWCRELNVTVPVLEPAIWQQPKVLSSLHDVLRHLTGDTWTLTFVQWQGRPPIGSRQGMLDLGR